MSLNVIILSKIDTGNSIGKDVVETLIVGFFYILKGSLTSTTLDYRCYSMLGSINEQI